MIVETTCERGIVRLPPDLDFRHDTFKVKVEVPDQELVAPPTATVLQTSVASTPHDGGIRARIDAILGPYKEQLQQAQPFSAQDYRELWREHLEEKYLGRR